MTYKDYTGLDRTEFLSKVRHMMSDKRFNHVLGVERAAIELAERYGYDKEKAGLAALLHDYAKELSDDEFLRLIDKYQPDPDLKKWGNNIWHGLVGIYKIQEDLAIKDQDILAAIAKHTVGSAQMSTLDKIVYVADYIEHNRDFPGVEEARELAKVDLNKAVAYETARTVAFLASKAQPIYPKTIETYNAYIPYLD
ncbi:TPA: bis(5'-nucleosyl)-tetraphosphatase (symmetrical) YqeK [Streptococcus agalactiae]|uniref:bis(5'-nucleosyl)-tetraphosphatase (symmetrical) YqeK n=1 Tax=Streptococcus agalactiae TaxID=1311 RepID=UPI000CECD1A9|nr:bis(5'-nucleosyl)-tetraphosphatase (symmetrical) YqeK [Streptococcus agalactiae]MCD0136389.1 HD domain-containing protein [Streptococcus agalactiae]PPQ23235.1 HD domain-containing protein [Streptococcus agalactiae]PPQ25359.1 HD domain-containing protein [Streptococcus agalactiae]HEM9941318.1 bis(5'-nucleosyl)-tetraphosphatase (symmetrical) YqeK [Streptococcus agalactiae]HEN0060155.1 bis(5'-nucleosyl)-tetraphosphatase (symmetrical) YqeK [Streptococcus agalactiae]